MKRLDLVTLFCVIMLGASTIQAEALAATSVYRVKRLKSGTHFFHQTRGHVMSFTLESPAFTDKGPIPTVCTCDGRDTSPELRWSGAPNGTKSFALIVDDPDAPDPAAPKMTFVHWVLFNIPPDVTEMPEGVSELPPGTREGFNDQKRTGYTGPCPPIGTHRYFHKLYALDAMLDISGTPTKEQLLKAMEGHILAQTTLMGSYARGK